jgi:hypothetical protein
MKLDRIGMKYKAYFDDVKLSIMDCVIISDEESHTVHIIKSDLPPDIKNNIEIMFWK